MVCGCMCVKSGIPQCVSEWFSFLWFVFACIQNLACENMFAAGTCICVYLFPFFFQSAHSSNQPVFTTLSAFATAWQHMRVYLCSASFPLCACWSILAFEEKYAVRSPWRFPFQHWIRDGAMICGNNFFKRHQSVFLSLSSFHCLSLFAAPPLPSWASESALLCALNER